MPALHVGENASTPYEPMSMPQNTKRSKATHLVHYSNNNPHNRKNTTESLQKRHKHQCHANAILTPREAILTPRSSHNTTLPPC